MMLAIQNIQIGRLPPYIPPAPGGWCKDPVPPGPFYPLNTKIPYTANQTCYGTIRFHSTFPGESPVWFWVVVDLDHPDDDEEFTVTLSFWLIWQHMHEVWLVHEHLFGVRNHEVLGPFRSDSPGLVVGPYYGWFDLQYGNLHQRVRVERDEPMRCPVNPCYSGHTHVALRNRSNPLLPLWGHRDLYPPNSDIQWNVGWWRDDTPRGGRRQLHNFHMIYHDATNTLRDLQMFHLLGFWSPYWRRFIFDHHQPKRDMPWSSKKYRSHPWDWVDQMYTLCHHQGTLYNFNHKHKTRSTCAIGLPPPTPNRS